MNKKYNWSDTLYVTNTKNDYNSAKYFLFRNINKLVKNRAWLITVFSWENQFYTMVNSAVF